MSETVEQYKRRVAQAGGFGRARTLTAKQRRASAIKAARARWKKNDAIGEIVREVTEGTKALEAKTRAKQKKEKEKAEK